MVVSAAEKSETKFPATMWESGCAQPVGRFSPSKSKRARHLICWNVCFEAQSSPFFFLIARNKCFNQPARHSELLSQRKPSASSSSSSSCCFFFCFFFLVGCRHVGFLVRFVTAVAWDIVAAAAAALVVVVIVVDVVVVVVVVVVFVVVVVVVVGVGGGGGGGGGGCVGSTGLLTKWIKRSQLSGFWPI